MALSRRTRGLIGLVLVTPLLAAFAMARAWTVLQAMSTKSITAHVGLPGGPTAEFDFSVADTPLYFALTWLQSVVGAIGFGGAATVIAVTSWWKLRNVTAYLFSSKLAASLGGVWVASFLVWLALVPIVPILISFTMF